MWRTLKDLMDQNKYTGVSELNFQGKLETNHHVISNELNNNFINSIEEITKNITNKTTNLDSKIIENNKILSDFKARRYLTDKELEIILNEGPDILADVPDNLLDDDSEEDMEHLEYQDHNSASEDEYVPEDSSDSDTDVQKKNVLWEKISKLLGITRSFVPQKLRMRIS
ncbi:hypothetical protein WA026_014280 [Henosepilachna vigintioctopunctata]|uniref:Uncharacterized protein n=1 Tax=Henosepilachna vigintioctopunctata TaxID=420089 RepID=A0AAW1TTX0_9CUCU